MNLTITKMIYPSFVTLLQLDGKLDGSNFENIITETQKLYDEGTRHLILDLGALEYISSAGMAALHQVALMFRGEKHPGLDEGWAAYRAMNRDRSSGFQEHIKLLSPTRQVREVLNMTGFNSFFEIFTDLQLALASFHQVAPVMEARLP